MLQAAYSITSVAATSNVGGAVMLGDVRAFILKQPEHIQERGSWQHAAELMILAAERGGSIEAATTQIEDALFLEARYVRQWH